MVGCRASNVTPRAAAPPRRRECGGLHLDTSTLHWQATGVDDRARVRNGWLPLLLAAGAVAQGTVHTVVQGRVLGPLAEPLRDVEVWATTLPATDQRFASARTDGDGAFVLAKVPRDADLAVLATAPGHTTGRAVVLAGDGPPCAPVQLRLWEAIAIRGRVLDAAGVPIAGAGVLGTRDFAAFDGEFVSPEATSDAQGDYELRGVPIGDYVLRAWARGCLLRQFWYTATADEERVLHLERGQGGVLTVSAQGLSPAAAAATRVRLSAPFLLPGAMTTGVLDDLGRWQATGLIDLPWTVALSAPACVFVPREQNARIGVGLSFTAWPEPSLPLRGVLRGPDGHGLPGLTIVRDQGRHQGHGVPAEMAAVTDAAGCFRLTLPLREGEAFSVHLADSPWVLQQDKEPQHRGFLTRDWLSHFEGTADPKQDLQLHAVPAAFVRAHVVDQDGAPVPFLRAELLDRMDKRAPEWSVMACSVTGPDGTVAFPGVAAIGDQVRVHAADSRGAGVSAPFLLAAAQLQRIELQLQRPGTVEGTVVSAAGGPLPGARVSLCEGGEPGDRLTTVPADRQGRFRFVGVEPGSHRLVLDRGRQVQQLGTVEVPAGGVVHADLRAGR